MTLVDYGLDGEVSIVTGGNSGIGGAICESLAAAGTAVLVHFLDPETVRDSTEYTIEHSMSGALAAEEICRRVRSHGARAVAVSGNLSDPMTVGRLFDEAHAHLGPVNILVNNAAHCELPDTIMETTAGSIDRHFTVNTRAAILLVAEFARQYRRLELDHGRIINISTDAARAFASQISYGASKAATEAFTRSTAIELGPLGITVNAVAPGPVQTGWIGPDLESKVLPWIPLGRLGTPDDIARTVTFLASARSGWLTGQVIKVSGGHNI